MVVILLLRLWVLLLRVVELGPATRRAVGQFGAAVEAVTPRKRREETGTIVSVTRAGNERVIAARVRVGDQLVDVPWNGAGAREGDVVMLSRALGSAAAPDWSFERFADSLSAYPVADDSADIPPPLFVNPFVTTTMLTAAAQQGAQVTLHLTETPAAYGPASIEIRWRKAGTSESWRRLTIADQAGVDAAIQAVLPELLEPGVAYDFQARTTTVGGATSPYGDLLTRTLDPAIPAPAQPPPFVAAPTVPYIDSAGNVEMVIHYPPPNQPTMYDYWQTEIATAAGGPTSWTLQHYGAIGNFKAPSPGSYYVRYREVSKYSSGGARVASPWQPASGYAGPFVLTAGPSGVDLDAPATPGAPTLSTAAGYRAGAFTIWVDATLGGYIAPPDLAGLRYTLRDAVSLYQVESFLPGQPAQFLGLKPATLYTASVAARDASGNMSPDGPNATIVTPAIVAPTGAPIVTVVMGSNRAALTITWAGEPGIKAIGFNVYGSPNISSEAATYLIGFAPAQVTTDGGKLMLIHVVAPVTTDPYSGVPLNGVSWGFAARVVSQDGVEGPRSVWFVGIFQPDNGQNLIAGSITGDKMNANVVLATQRMELAGSAYLHDTANNIRAKADGFYAGWNTFPTNYVYLGAEGLRSVGEGSHYYVAGSGATGGSGWRGTAKATTYVSPGAGPTGLTIRAVDAKIAGQVEYANDIGWTLDNQALKFYDLDWPAAASYRMSYAIDGARRLYDGGRKRVGMFHPNYVAAGINLAGSAANTPYAIEPSYWYSQIPTSGLVGCLIRGFINAPAGARFYASNWEDWLWENGGSIVVPAGATAVDFGPWIIPMNEARNSFRYTCSAACSGTMWISGYFR